MQAGDIVRDDKGHAYELLTELGRGLWGRSWLACVEGTDEVNRVVKVPLEASDFPEDGERLAGACRQIALEQGRLLETSGAMGLVSLEARFQQGDVPVIVQPNYPSTLASRLEGDASLEDILQGAMLAANTLRSLGDVLEVHGNLRPTNVLLTEGGEVRLADPVTPAMKPLFTRLVRAHSNAGTWLAPEVREAGDNAPLSVAADTYTLALAIWLAAMGPAGERELPAAGLDKSDLVSLKDKVRDRLKRELANPRFHTRLADRAAALLNRALSREVSPSPPYRFAKATEFVQRVGEVHALVHPQISHVGKLLLAPSPGAESFTTDDEIAFSCTIGASAGVETHEEIACGVAIFDEDKNERMRSLPCSYTVDRHPTGRFRFGFRIAEVPPGAYRVRVAFTIRDSGAEPNTIEGIFRVAAAPGYVPPPREPEPKPIPLTRPEPGPTTKPGVVDDGGPPPLGAGSMAGMPVPGMPVPGLPDFDEVSDLTLEEVSNLDASAEDSAEVVQLDLQTADSDDAEEMFFADAGDSESGIGHSDSGVDLMTGGRSPAEPTLRPPPSRPPRDAGPSSTRPASGVTAVPVRGARPPIPVVAEHFDGPDTTNPMATPPGSPPAKPKPTPSADLPDVDEPEYKGAGRWTELPLPGVELGGDDLDGDELAESTPQRRRREPPDPDNPLNKVVEMLKGDAYLLFIGGAVLVILLLIVALIVLH